MRSVPEDGRAIPLLTYFDHVARDWCLYVFIRPGELGRMAGGEVFSGSYVAHERADPASDLELPLGTLLVQHLSFTQIITALQKL